MWGLITSVTTTLSRNQLGFIPVLSCSILKQQENKIEINKAHSSCKQQISLNLVRQRLAKLFIPDLCYTEKYSPVWKTKNSQDQGWKRTLSFSKVRHCEFEFWTHQFWPFRMPCDSWNHKMVKIWISSSFHTTNSSKINTTESNRKVFSKSRKIIKYSTFTPGA